MVHVEKYNEIEKEDSLDVITAKLNAIGASQPATLSPNELIAFISKVKTIIAPAKLRMWICAGIGREEQIFTSVRAVLDIYSFKMEAYRP